jgi:hypothetical protein
MLGFHGLAMNGGFAHSLEVDLPQAQRAANGFRLFGEPNIAELVGQGCQIVSSLAKGGDENSTLDFPEKDPATLEKLEGHYDKLVPSDDKLQQIFRRYLSVRPHDFEPL